MPHATTGRWLTNQSSVKWLWCSSQERLTLRESRRVTVQSKRINRMGNLGDLTEFVPSCNVTPLASHRYLRSYGGHLLWFM